MIRLLLKFFSVLPLRVNHAIGSLFGRMLYWLNTESKLVAQRNIHICFAQLTAQEKDRLLRKTLIEAGKSFTESSYIWLKSFNSNNQDVLKIHGLELLKAQQPIILLTPHIGCWEITGRVLSLVRPLTFLYKPLRSKSLEKWLFSQRQQGDLSMASADKKGVIKLQRSLSAAGAIGILPDQYPGDEGSVVVPFFQHQARTMTLLAKLARRNQAKVILTWAKRLPAGKGFELYLRPIEILSNSGELIDDVELMNQAIEKLVLECPEQYLWTYKRFKSIIRYN